MNKLLEFKLKADDLDNQDPIKEFKSRFVSLHDSGKIYFCSHSLGLPAISSFSNMQKQLQNWAKLGVDGWFSSESDWYNSFDIPLRRPLSNLLGAKFNEVIVMNSLTVNLHLLLVSFYRPTNTRFKILIDSPTFPSDLYAIKSHIYYHGLNPDEVLIIMEPRSGEQIIRIEDIQQIILEKGETIALVFLSSINFLTGQVFDMELITKLAKSKGCLVGYNVAHALGNVPLQFHKWNVDFAVGCSYKYLCGGPGGPGIAYIHSYHHNEELFRFSGWWGNDPKTRFQMHLQAEFIPYGGAYGWQVSTPSVLAMTPLVASLEIFEEIGINNLREKSKKQVDFLLEFFDLIPSYLFEVITPRSCEFRGSQLSLFMHTRNYKKYLKKLEEKGIVCDFRPPNIIRVAPSPLYNTFNEIFEFSCKIFDIFGIKV